MVKCGRVMRGWCEEREFGTKHPVKSMHNHKFSSWLSLLCSELTQLLFVIVFVYPQLVKQLQ